MFLFYCMHTGYATKLMRYCCRCKFVLGLIIEKFLFIKNCVYCVHMNNSHAVLFQKVLCLHLHGVLFNLLCSVAVCYACRLLRSYLIIYLIGLWSAGLILPGANLVFPPFKAAFNAVLKKGKQKVCNWGKHIENSKEIS